ncbi:hypothetical protein [Sphingobium sp. CAP-1]|uniref:hypothetical protein n=1 Tax=Sphingobium sp. CAP-1 TaxID=2676077 RepID=UPI0012BB2F0D|nr:hypothetical protein [Sphingobium sp. CAP-1]QGP78377.1 hypothetical protein GL174_04775 [Sphingobium sp. CAP-1]
MHSKNEMAGKIRAVHAENRAIENWLHDSALPSYDAYQANPASGVSLSDVRAGLDVRARSAKG